MTKGITLESILDPAFSKNDKSCYKVTFKVKKETQPGQSLCIVGDIPELGQWQKFNCCMTWTEGHVWIIENLEITSKPFFNYKYVVLVDGNASEWERGENRIADLRAIKDGMSSSGSQIDMSVF